MSTVNAKLKDLNNFFYRPFNLSLLILDLEENYSFQKK